MCGLVGIAGPGIAWKDIQILKDLAYISGLRGRDGTGVLQGQSQNYGKKKNSFLVAKSQYEVSYFQYFHENEAQGEKELFKGIQNNFFAVHTRGASRGDVNDDNAHPFVYPELIGMHNGTLFDTKYYSKKKTDSELLFLDISKRGLLPVLTGLNPESAYALVIYDRDTGKLTFVRNRKRDLYFCFSDDRSVMYWASEKEMLELALKRNSQKVLDDRYDLLDPFKVATVHPGEIGLRKKDVFTVQKYLEPTWDGFYRKNPKDKQLHEEMQRQQEQKAWVKSSEVSRGISKITHLPNPSDHPTARVVYLNEMKRNQEFSVNILEKGEKIPKCSCSKCGNNLSLVEQFLGTKDGDKITCESCVAPSVPVIQNNEVKVG